MDVELIKVVNGATSRKKHVIGKTSRKRKRTSSGLIEVSETMKGTETDFEEFVIDRTITPQRKLKVKDIERASEGTESSSKWRKSLESTLLGSTPQSASEKQRSIKKTCFNCAGDHNLRDCPRPRNFQRISKNKKELAETPRRFVPDSVGLSKHKSNNFKPGELSDTLRDALGLNPNDIPDHVYRMRRLGFIKGYPPGWLRKAIKTTETLKIFTSDEPKDDLGNESMQPPELDISKIVCYPGFNGESESLNDIESFKIPPAEVFHSVYQKELTEIFEKQQKAVNKNNKRKIKNSAKHKKFDDDDDDVVIVMEKGAELNRTEFKTPGEDEDVTILDGCLYEDSSALKAPVRENVKKGESLFKVIGTPTFDRHNLTPVAPLEAFAVGIQPFMAGKEDVQTKGSFRKLMDKLKEVREQSSESIIDLEAQSVSITETLSNCEASEKSPILKGKKNKKSKKAKKNLQKSH